MLTSTFFGFGAELRVDGGPGHNINHVETGQHEAREQGTRIEPQR